MPSVALHEIRGGIAARTGEIGLVGHGIDEERAVSNLRSAVEIWARCLARAGILEASLIERGVHYVPNGERITVELRGAPVPN
jgi:hypothetical protein